MMREVEEGYAAAVGTTSKVCKTAADCVEVKASCVHNCETGAIAGSALHDYDQAVFPYREACTKFNAMGCTVALAIPTATCNAHPPPTCGPDGTCHLAD